ncbi:hypothetical protein ACH5RR_037538 [Cinchona calisaya]|uniref:Uncharacterized protein n=1 Tax=Cinchona calisaya TaxID=153742 RepID=A0ABD2YAM8_9GENT
MVRSSYFHFLNQEIPLGWIPPFCFSAYGNDEVFRLELLQIEKQKGDGIDQSQSTQIFPDLNATSRNRIRQGISQGSRPLEYVTGPTKASLRLTAAAGTELPEASSSSHVMIEHD